jgi:hypothetical protein
MLWRDMRGRTKEIHKELQDLDSLCSPHLEERWIGGNIDLDPPLFSLKNMQESWEEWRRNGKLFKVNNGGERSQIVASPMRKKGCLYSPLQI